MKDAQLNRLIKQEVRRQNDTIDLIASENFASRAVMRALGTPLTNKYSEGYPGKRYYPGNVYYDAIEQLAQERALKMFRLDREKWHVNVQPYSGSPANIAIYAALMQPGETLMGMALSSGGHLTHGHKVSLSGIFWRAVQYVVNQKTGRIDYDEVAKIAKREKPKIIVSGFTAYPRMVDFNKFGEIARAVGAYHVSDISHIAGLIVAGAHPSPFPHADVVMTTTHKTLRGPRGAIILCRRELASQIDRAVFPGAQGGPHNNVTAAKAVAFFEALQPSFKQYGKQVVKNARALAVALKRLGCVLITGGSDTHLLLVDVRNFGIDGLEGERRLERAGIIANRNTIPGDTSPFKPSGVRIGTPSATTRGMKEQDMRVLAQLIYDAFSGKQNVRRESLQLCKKFPATRFLKV